MTSSGLHRRCAHMHVLIHKHIHNFKILTIILIQGEAGPISSWWLAGWALAGKPKKTWTLSSWVKNGPLWCHRKTDKHWRKGRAQSRRANTNTETKMSRGRNLFKKKQLWESQNWYPHHRENSLQSYTMWEEGSVIQRALKTKQKGRL